ncbi:MAG: FliH/SctL family protein [SAR324 cluster bacterium]|nr:FliH/SctL family protein [SAR324 cluster bacterium]
MSDFKPPLFEDISVGVTSAPPKAAAPTALKGPAETFTPVDFETNTGTFGGKKLSTKSVKDVKFEAGRFMEEGTLLTNVEEYSKKVRQSADIYAKTTREEAGILKSEIETELAQANIIVQKAEAEAKQIIADAEAGRNEIKRQAAEQGYVEGLSQGKTEFREQNEALSAKIVAILQQIANLRTEMYKENENALAQLALVSAEKLVYKNLSQEKDFVLAGIQDSIKQMEGTEKIKIRINPLEYAFLKEHLPEIEAYADEDQSINFKADPEIAPACALIESDFSQISLNLSGQFSLIHEQLKSCFEERRSLFQPQKVDMPPEAPETKFDPNSLAPKPANPDLAKDQPQDPDAPTES